MSKDKLFCSLMFFGAFRTRLKTFEIVQNSSYISRLVSVRSIFSAVQNLSFYAAYYNETLLLLCRDVSGHFLLSFRFYVSFGLLYR